MLIWPQGHQQCVSKKESKLINFLYPLFQHLECQESTEGGRGQKASRYPAEKDQHHRARVQKEEDGVGAKGLGLEQRKRLARSCVCQTKEPTLTLKDGLQAGLLSKVLQTGLGRFPTLGNTSLGENFPSKADLEN